MTDDEQAELKKQLEQVVKAREEEGRQQRETEARELRAWFDRELLKRDVLDQLNPKPSRGKWLENPAVLLLAGFIFTTVGGTIFGSCWQGRQNTLEQQRLTRQAVIKQKYDVKDEFIKAIAEVNTTAEDVIYTFRWDLRDTRRKTEVPERMANFMNASRNWRTKSKMLLEDIRFRFRDPEILRIFEDIRIRRSTVALGLLELQDRVEKTRGAILKDDTRGYEPDFVLSDFADHFDDFVKKVSKGDDPVSRHLKTKLFAQAPNIFSADQKVDKQVLVRALNQVLKDNSFYEPETFKGVSLSSETNKLLQLKRRAPAKIAWLNRRLLEDAFKDEITKAGFTADFGRIEATRNYIITTLTKQLMEAMKNEILADEVASELTQASPTPTPSP